jgi:hypothetical protein
MMKHTCISLDDPSRWGSALAGVPHAFGHTWEHCYGMHLSSGLLTFLYYFEAENTRIVCPFSERTYGGHVDLVTPYGFSGFTGSGSCADFPSHWRPFAQIRRYVCGYIGLHPLFENDTYL